MFPEAYDRITVVKGPQTVLNGPGNAAGSVLFERTLKRFDKPGWKFNGSVTLGSFGRNDAVADVRAGTPDYYIQGAGTWADSDDYKDGDGNTVHSRYTRWSGNAAIGWTPDDNTRLEFSGARSDGEAAYADRTMDGVKFDRENLGLKFEKRKVSEVVDKIEAQIYYNYIDHVMDNYTLRPATGARMVSNPDRETIGGRAAIGLRLSENVKTTLGMDYQLNTHTLRSTMNETTMPYENKPRIEDANFRNYGLFGEMNYVLDDRDRIIGGLRADQWHAEDRRGATYTLSNVGVVANPTSGASRDKTLYSGFGRFERDLSALPATFYAGIGHVERFPDYWELISFNKESANSSSAFDTRPEKTTQIDIGIVHNGERLSGSLSAFANSIGDYILIQSGVTKTSPSRTVVIARNIDATTYGGEAGVAYALTDAWKLDATLAYVHGENDTDGRPLAQMPPLEGRLGLNYDNKVWSAGALLRMVAEQDRYAVNQGNIVGQDLGRTPGFSVFSINGGWRPKKGMLIAAGVDNLFDRTYAEHISRSAATVPGFLVQSTRVNEPGRTFWIKASIKLD